MMVMYAFEKRHALFILAFAIGCALSSSYGFLAKTWPFGVVEAIWCVVVPSTDTTWHGCRSVNLLKR
jgi:hypothetical protein